MRYPFQQLDRTATIVIAVCALGILGALILFPSGAFDGESKARAKARDDAFQIATAIERYRLEYGHLPAISPTFLGTNRDTGDEKVEAENRKAYNELLEVLSPSTSRAQSALNPKGISFISIPRATSDGHNGRIGGTGPYLDSWGRPYCIQLAGDLGDWVGDPTTMGSRYIHKCVIVWSQGDPTRYFDEYCDPKKWIKSWE